MRAARTVAVLGAAAAAGALLLAAPAAADPNMPPCGQLAPFCNMVPMMPELDHDIDLTKQQPPEAGLDQENLVPADVCNVGCI